MNILLLGGTSGFGRRIADVLSLEHSILSLGRGNGFDLHDGRWLANVRGAISSLWGGTQYLDAVVMAAYDRRFEQTNIQLNACQSLYGVLRSNEQVKLCIIGDMVHHYTPNESLYTSNKRALYNQVVQWSRDPERQCGLFLYEPWMVRVEDQASESFITGMRGLGTGEFQIRTQRT